MKTDVTAINQGTIYIFFAHSPAARQWFDDNTDAFIWGTHGYIVGHRFARDIAQALVNDGFTVN